MPETQSDLSLPYNGKLFIDGEFIESEGGNRFDVEDPASRDVIGSVADGTAEDIDIAVDAARDAYETCWRQLSARDRGEYLFAVADAIEDEFEEFVELETLENGKPLEQSRSDVREAAKTFRYYGGGADKYHGDTIPEKRDLFDYTVQEPYGVVGSIIPWNWPPMHTADFTAAPIACGNTVVLKPAPEAPLSSLKMAEIWQRVLPDGVVNVVTGSTEPGVRLSRHDGVNKIGFTGHTETGTKIMESAAQTITSVMLELGGKNPNIVLPDAPLDDAVAGTVAGLLTNTGQACAGCERLLLHEDIADEFLDAFIDHISALTIGPGIDSETDIGPLANAKQYEKVTDYISLGKSEGATVLYEGEVPEELGDGFYVPPVVFGDVDGEMRIVNEEVFGPVIVVRKYSSVRDAIEIANDTEYGLTGAVWTRDARVGNRLARRIDAGIVYINNYDNGTFLGAPFGGFGRSGMGKKLAFEETMQEFTRTKTVRTRVASEDLDELDDYY
ncbi:aldehyde dehydrogenase [Natrarchaeobius sp. A-rgal3]|uniref:aldehyde dehydrogenase family protein n=1 Tax=Natrarchaeobius versutus TaxID=1679078 RepID=UPI0035100BF3